MCVFVTLSGNKVHISKFQYKFKKKNLSSLRKSSCVQYHYKNILTQVLHVYTAV